MNQREQNLSASQDIHGAKSLFKITYYINIKTNKKKEKTKKYLPNVESL